MNRSGMHCGRSSVRGPADARGLKAAVLLAAAFLVCAGPSASAADVIEKLNGQKLRGTVLKEDTDYVTLGVRMPGGGSLEMRMATKDIHAVTVKGERRVVNARPAGESGLSTRKTPARPTVKAPARRRKTAPEDPAKRKTRTSTQVLTLIDKEGRTRPPWWDSVRLNYPPTLDLTWQVQGRNWDPNRHLAQYLFGVIHANPSKFKEGVKLVHKSLEVNKNDPGKLDYTMGQLGNLYHDLLNDHARAAYWWGKTKSRGVGIRGSLNLGLADCYWQLGCKPMAVPLLQKLGRDRTPYCNVARLWSEVGEFNIALKMAEASAKAWPDAGYLAAGDVCRYHGRYKQALQYYQMAVSTKRANRNKRFKQRAQASLDAIKVFELLDLSRIRDGTYSGDALAFRGQVYVDVSVRDAKIVSAKVTRHREDRAYCALTEIPKRIVEKQGLKGVDAVSGATVTAEAIINAAAKALASGMR